MEKPKYLSAINISIYIIIIILAIIKLVLNFTETVYTASVICNIIFTFILLICAIILIILYKYYLVRFIVGYVVLAAWIGGFISSLISYSSIINESKMRAIFNFVSYTKLGLSMAIFILGIVDEYGYDNNF